jgi:ankyrin repeat protein
MARTPNAPSRVSSAAQSLPPRPNLDHLKKEAKRRLALLKASDPSAKLADSQFAVARDYGFASWRALKAHVDALVAAQDVFAAARANDVDSVRRALENGFDAGLVDETGRTIHQLAKANGFGTIELLARQYQERSTRPPSEEAIVSALLAAAEKGDAAELARRLDAHPDLIDARGGNFQKQTALHVAAWRNHGDCVRLLLERGANPRIRDFGDNAYALHFAAEAADFDVVEALVEAGSDVVGAGDDHQLEVIGWATCFRRVREDVANYLLRRGAKLNLWSAIALGRVDDVRHILEDNPALIRAGMSRSEHHRTPLHHAAMKNRPAIVRLLIGLGADVNAPDAAGTTPVAAAAQAKADNSIIAMLTEAGAKLDFIAALNLGRFDLAEAMLREDPGRVGRDGRDTIALHLATSGKNVDAVRWLISHGVDVNAKRKLWDCNHTALHIVAAEGGLEIARLLLDAGADPSIRDDTYNSTVLGWAEYCGQPEIADLVRQHMAAG